MWRRRWRRWGAEIVGGGTFAALLATALDGGHLPWWAWAGLGAAWFLIVTELKGALRWWAAKKAKNAVAVNRDLAEADPDRYRPELADSLDHLGLALWGLERWAEALPPLQEAVALYRGLAEADPDRYRPELADSLDRLGLVLAELDRPAEALPLAQEAVDLFREAVGVDPARRYRPELAASLDSLGIVLEGLGRPAEAQAARSKAAAFRHGHSQQARRRSS